MKILVIHGPNLNLLGKRDPEKYGTMTMTNINKSLQEIARSQHCELVFFHSNHEGDIIDFLQKESSRTADGAIINAGALIRYGYSLRAATIDFQKPIIEVHMSNILKTGVEKNINIFDGVRIDQVIGMQEKSYFEALRRLIHYIRSTKRKNL